MVVGTSALGWNVGWQYNAFSHSRRLSLGRSHDHAGCRSISQHRFKILYIFKFRMQTKISNLVEGAEAKEYDIAEFLVTDMTSKVSCCKKERMIQ